DAAARPAAFRPWLSAGGPARRGRNTPLVLHAVTHQADGRGVRRAGDYVDQATDAVRLADADGQAEAVCRLLVESGHQRRAAGDDHASDCEFQCTHVLFDVTTDQTENFCDPR